MVEGKHSVPFELLNMVFQGTVIGPMLWNVFFEDARLAVQEHFFEEVVFADDLSAFRGVPSSASNEVASQCCSHVQSELHK